MRAILHGGKFRIINMKKIIAIFSIMLTCFTMLISDGYGAGSCRQHLCKTDEDFTELLSVDGITGNDTGGSSKSSLAGKMCYHCDINNMWGDIGDDDCGFNTYVATVTASETKLFMCNDDAGDDDSWEKIDLSSLSVCSTSVLIRQGVSNATCVLSNSSGTDVVVTTTVSGPCMKCSCNAGFKENTAGTECVVDTSAQETCEKAPSHGYWDGSKCLCGAADRAGKDNKGYGQTYDVQDQKCKCSDSSQEWDETAGKCVDPDAADVAACEASGGNWSDGECKCNERTLTQSLPDKKTCVRNDAYYNCTASTSGGDWVSGACKCDSGKGLTGPNSDGACYCSDSAQVYDSGIGQCTDSAETVCKKTGGVWDGTNCDCDVSGKNIKKKDGSVPVQCECISPDYEWNADKTQGCKLSPEAENRKENFEKSKEACEAWGGTWSPGTWESPDGVDVTKWKCKCPNRAGVVQATAVSCKCDIIKGYQETAPNTCTQTTCADLQTKCNAVRDASYKTLTAHDGQKYCECVCDDEKNKAYNYSKNKCEAITNICDLIDDAVLDRYGNCVCKSNWLPPVRGKCPSGTSSGSVSGGGASPGVTVSPQQIARAKQNVSDVYDDLKSISDGFGRSHWKTASGNFNGARLASDSIAGVVLGTVGGVVTSNVIKKNQVKGGFESLQCTVGGQLVADFGDQFQVGIR